MKRIVSKIFVVLFAFVLIVQPLLQFTGVTETVQAKLYYSLSEMEADLGPNQYATYVTEKKYSTKYTVTTTIYDVTECTVRTTEYDKNPFDVMQIHRTSLDKTWDKSELKYPAKITAFEKHQQYVNGKPRKIDHNYAGTSIHEEYIYDVDITAEMTYESDWQTTEYVPPVLLMIDVNYRQYAISVRKEMTHGEVIPVQTRYKATIYTRNSNTTTSSEKAQKLIEVAQDNAGYTGDSSSSGGGSNYSGGGSNYSGGGGSNYYNDDSSYYYDEPAAPQYERISKRSINMNDAQKRLYIRQLYLRLESLRREPSNDEINYWMQFPSIHELTRSFIVANHPTIYDLAYEDMLTLFVRYIAGREPNSGDFEEYANWFSEFPIYERKEDLLYEWVNKDEFTDTRLRATKTMTFNKDLCAVIFDKMRGAGYEVVRPTDTTIEMFQDDVNKVTSLDLSGKELTNLAGLSNFTNLTYLNVNNNNITDTTEIGKLTKLTTLILSGNNISGKVGPIYNLTNLEELRMENCGLVDSDINTLNTMKKLTKMKRLYLSNNKLTNIGGLSSLSNLEILYVDSNNLRHIGNMDFSKINDVSLKKNKVEIKNASSEIYYDTFLRAILQSGNKLYSNNITYYNCSVTTGENGKIVITDLDKNMSQIHVNSGVASSYTINIINTSKKVELNDKVLADRLEAKLKDKGIITERKEQNGKYYLYFDTSKIPSVKNLDLSATDTDSAQITDITGIEVFENLTSLKLNNNRVSNLEKLASLNKLNTLEIKNNGLTNLNSIKDLVTLTQLDASSNAITDISGVSNLKDLRVLLLNNNMIKNNLSPLQNLDKLSALLLDNNSISNVLDLKGLNLSTLHISYNNVSNIEVLDYKTIGNFMMQNNIINISTSTDTIELPEVVKYVLSNGGEKDLELTNCTIQDNKVVLNEGSPKAKITVKLGKFGDTTINISSTKTQITAKVIYSQTLNNVSSYYTYDDLTADDLDELELSASDITKLSKNDNVTFDGSVGRVYILSNRRIPEDCILGSGSIEGKTGRVLHLNFLYNVENYNVRIADEYGNDTIVTLNFSGLSFSSNSSNSAEKVRNEFTVKYSESTLTNKDVTVTISVKEDEIYLFDIDRENGWQLSSDRKSIYKTYTRNTDEGDTVRLLNASDYGYTHGPAFATLEVYNIDKDAPICDVKYSTKEATKGSVKVEITANEDIGLVQGSTNAEYGSLKYVDDNGNSRYGVTLWYSSNATEDIQVKDLAGNIQTVHIDIKNIDNKVENVTSTLYGQTLKIQADEKIKLMNAIDSEENVEINTLASRETKVLMSKPVYTLASNINVSPLMSSNLSDGVYTRVAETNTQITSAENEVTFEILEGDQGIVGVEDEVGNTEFVLYDGTTIDNEAPIIYRGADITNDDGSVTVTLIISEEIQDTDDLAGWTLDEDKRTLTKTFTANAIETVTVKDLAGNAGEYTLELTGVERIEYNLFVEDIEGTEQALVIIKTNTELKEIPGWTMLEDGKSMAKVFYYTETENVVIEDNNGNSSEIHIALKAPEKEKNEQQPDIQKQQDDPKPEEPKEEQTPNMSTKPLPQTGVYATFTVLLIVILIVITLISLKKYISTMED